MKTTQVLLLFVWVLGVYTVKGQDINYEDFYDYLDTTRISTGVLYNKVIPYSSFMEYTGTNDTVVSSSEDWYQLFFELYNAHLGTPAMPDILALTDSVQSELNAFRVPIGILNMNYNLIKDSALINNLLVIQDSVLHDGPNTSESPYTTHRCFAAAALIDDCPLEAMTFFVSDDYLFENTGEDVLYYVIDFDDGNGARMLDPNEEYTVEYFTTGAKVIEIEAWLTGGLILSCFSTFTVSEVNPIMQRAARAAQSPPNNNYPDAVVSAVYNDVTYTGNYGIWYGCDSENQIRKPVIFVEGYDPSNQSTLSGGQLYETANQESFATNLRNHGCDVIILDFKDGAAKIQANAMVLRALIDTINAMKVTHNELVIIGASMGGLVARYALSYMEQQQENHQTRLFISYDTPHQGAYGSLAGQHLLTTINKVNNTPLCLIWLKTAMQIWDRVRFMNSDAAKQMLVYHHSATDGKKAKPHAMRTAFMNELTALPNNGYPSLSRNIAIACGAGNGTGQGFNAGVEQIKLDTLIKPINYYLKIRALPDHSEVRILDLDLNLKIPWKFMRLRGILTIPIPFLNDVRVTVNNTDPYDNCPGGNYGIIGGLADAIYGELGIDYDYPFKECFVPTVSALDLDKTYLQSINDNGSYLMVNIHKKINNNKKYNEISNQNITYFNAIYSDTINLSHITGGGINDTTATWMLKEIIRDTIRLNNQSFSSLARQYEAKTSIIAASLHPVIINNGADITFVAGESITLKSGFQVESGSTFTAKIHRYNGTISSPSFMASAPRRKETITPISSTVVASERCISLELDNKTSIIPNPSKGTFMLHTGWSNSDSGVITIYNVMGKLIHREIIKGASQKIQISQPCGVYLLQVTDANFRKETVKFIISL